MADFLNVSGSIAAAALAAAGLLAASPRARWAAFAAALTVSAAIVLGLSWDGELRSLRDQPVALAGIAIAAAGLVSALALAISRRPLVLPVAALLALPIRVPIETAGEDANLLLPLYLVIGAGVLASLARSGRGSSQPLSAPLLLRGAFAAALVLYAVQSAYSRDIEAGTVNVIFFGVPFAALFALLSQVRWDRRTLLAAGGVFAAEAVLFAAIGIGQHIAGGIFWNPALEASNDFHFYIRVNSVFWDPNIYGRYLALAALVVLSALVFAGGRLERGRAALLAGVLAVIWTGLLLAFSQSSFISLLTGIVVIVGLRWGALRGVAAGAAAVAALAAGIAFLAAPADDGGTRSDADSISSGRTTLVSGGLRLFGDRPLAGHGSASFSAAFREAENERRAEQGLDPLARRKTTLSHNEPVTVAAEQGVIGLLAYAALILASLAAAFGGVRAIAPGFQGDRAGASTVASVARFGLAASFCALLVHTVGYAGYLTDPLTWALLAVAGALAARSPATAASGRQQPGAGLSGTGPAVAGVSAAADPPA